jgi:hypothetical protein
MRASIKLDSKNALANRIANKQLSKEKVRELIDSVVVNHSSLWHDNLAASKPEDGKWVRSAHGTDLGKLLRLIDRCILVPLDTHLPKFMFGGRKGMSNITAALQLLGYEKERSLLALDIKRFFESVDIARVEGFYRSMECSPRFTESLSRFSCVPRGAKDKPEDVFALARGFSTSTRLAAWSYITTFHKIHDLAMKRLKPYDPRIAVFIDDIGITASRVPEEVLRALANEIDTLLSKDSDGAVRLNQSKTKVLSFTDGIEHLGVAINRNKLVMPKDLIGKKVQLEQRYEKTKSPHIKLQLKGLRAYEQAIRRANTTH